MNDGGAGLWPAKPVFEPASLSRLIKFTLVGLLGAALTRFHLSNGAVSLFGNTTLIYLFVNRFRMPVTLSAVAAIVLCGVLNFLFADRLVYRKSRVTALIVRGADS